jgi:hypothetical protein
MLMHRSSCKGSCRNSTDGGVCCGGAAAADNDGGGAGAYALPLISSADTTVLANCATVLGKQARRQTTVAPADDRLPCRFVAAKLGMLAFLGFSIYDNYKYINIFVVTGRFGMIELDLDDKVYCKKVAADH